MVVASTIVRCDAGGAFQISTNCLNRLPTIDGDSGAQVPISAISLVARRYRAPAAEGAGEVEVEHRY